MDLEKVRAEFPFIANGIYMNTGAGGAMPRPVTRAVQEVLEQEQALGPYHPGLTGGREELLAGVRKDLAGLVRAEVDEIALSDNTTSGLNIAASALDWHPGDEVILTDMEHPGGYLPWYNLRQTQGIEAKLVSGDPQAHRLLTEIERAMTPRTKLICLSHVAWCVGHVLPVAEVCAFARERGILVVVDAAQAVGQFPVDVKALGCHFYSFPGHKWLMGPMGTGALYVEREILGGLRNTSAGWASTATHEIRSFTFEPHRQARRFELATQSYALLAGLRSAVRFQAQIGYNEIAARISRGACRLLEALSTTEGVEVLTPYADAPLPVTGLVSFVIDGVPPAKTVKDLFESDRIICRAVPDPPAVRLSVNYFQTDEELERVIDCVRRQAAGRPR